LFFDYPLYLPPKKIITQFSNHNRTKIQNYIISNKTFKKVLIFVTIKIYSEKPIENGEFLYFTITLLKTVTSISIKRI